MQKTGALALAFLFMTQALAAEKLSESRPVLVTVNGVRIYQDLLENLVSPALANGAKDTPELRDIIKNELIAREVLAQEAVRLSLDKLPASQNQLTMARKSILAELALQKSAEKSPITEDMLRAEYQRQVGLLADTNQYLVSHIVLATEAEALGVLKAAQKGEPFEKLAKEKSLDNSRLNGGSLGWIMADQLIQPLAKSVLGLTKGALSAAPIQTPVGWQIIKLSDQRKFLVPSFEDSKPQLVKAVQTQLRAALVKKLVNAATVEGK